jgi:hypothetical protein
VDHRHRGGSLSHGLIILYLVVIITLYEWG